MLPTTLLLALGAVCTVLAQPTDLNRRANDAVVKALRGHQHRSHAHVARSQQNKLLKKRGGSKKKRCKAVSTTSSADSGATPTSAKTTKAGATPTATPHSSGSGSSGGSSGGVIQVQDAKCGDNGATGKSHVLSCPSPSVLHPSLNPGCISMLLGCVNSGEGDGSHYSSVMHRWQLSAWRTWMLLGGVRGRSLQVLLLTSRRSPQPRPQRALDLTELKYG